jgi:hypothetical protein
VQRAYDSVTPQAKMANGQTEPLLLRLLHAQGVPPQGQGWPPNGSRLRPPEAGTKVIPVRRLSDGLGRNKLKWPKTVGNYKTCEVPAGDGVWVEGRSGENV